MAQAKRAEDVQRPGNLVDAAIDNLSFNQVNRILKSLAHEPCDDLRAGHDVIRKLERLARGPLKLHMRVLFHRMAHETLVANQSDQYNYSELDDQQQLAYKNKFLSLKKNCSIRNEDAPGIMPAIKSFEPPLRKNDKELEGVAECQIRSMGIQRRDSSLDEPETQDEALDRRQAAQPVEVGAPAIEEEKGGQNAPIEEDKHDSDDDNYSVASFDPAHLQEPRRGGENRYVVPSRSAKRGKTFTRGVQPARLS